MKIKYGKGTSKYGPGVEVVLSSEDVVRAISAYLVAKGIHVEGSRTITVNEGLCREGRVYVDPSGFLMHKGKAWDGGGPTL